MSGVGAMAETTGESTGSRRAYRARRGNSPAPRGPGRAGRNTLRTPGAIGFASLRGGTVAGEHSVILAGEQERIVISHFAEER